MTKKQELHIEKLANLRRGSKCIWMTGRKHSNETKLKIGIANKGKLLGRNRSTESILKTALANTKGRYFNCLLCSTEFWRSPAHIKKGNCKFCSKDCYAKWQIGKPKNESFKEYCRGRIGNKSATWKGGITPDVVLIRNGNEIKKWRKSVFERDGYTCQDCGAKSCKGNHVYLEAHHIKAFATHPKLRLDIDNGVTLCKKCHSFKPKGKKVYEQYNAA